MTVRFRRKLRRSRLALSVRPVFSRPFPAMLALGLMAISGIGLAHAQGFGDPADGQRIAASICSGCHQIGIQSRDTKNDPIPSFQAIAGMPSTTMLAINVFLRTSHVA